MALKQLSDAGSEGTVLGQSATDLVGFYGANPVDQPAPIASSTATATSASTTVNAILVALREVGIVAAS
jgi:hypothetical protein